MRTAFFFVMATIFCGVAMGGQQIEIKLVDADWAATKVGEIPATQPAPEPKSTTQPTKPKKVIVSKPSEFITPPGTSVSVQNLTVGDDVQKMLLVKDTTKDDSAVVVFTPPGDGLDSGVVRIRFTLLLPPGEGTGEMNVNVKNGAEKLIGSIAVNVSSGMVLVIPPPDSTKKTTPVNIKVGKISKNKPTVFELYLNQDKNSETLEVQGLDRVVCPTQKFKFDRLEFASGEEQVGKFGIGKVEIAVTPSDAPAKSAPVKPASEKPAPAKPAPAKPAPEKPASEKK